MHLLRYTYIYVYIYRIISHYTFAYMFRLSLSHLQADKAQGITHGILVYIFIA